MERLPIIKRNSSRHPPAKELRDKYLWLILFEWARMRKTRLKRKCDYDKVGKYSEGWLEKLEAGFKNFE